MAIARAKEGIDIGQTPFAAVIVRNSEIIASEHNSVWKNMDITAHGEVQSIRAACKKVNSIDLSGSIIYSTCEPCPMCFTAIHWARIDKIVCGARIKDAKSFGFNELTVSNHTLKNNGNSKVEIINDFMREECIELFNYWASKTDKKAY
jgi:tRNA(Arg) A34 adenosine deaminase TadA